MGGNWHLCNQYLAAVGVGLRIRDRNLAPAAINLRICDQNLPPTVDNWRIGDRLKLRVSVEFRVFVVLRFPSGFGYPPIFWIFVNVLGILFFSLADFGYSNRRVRYPKNRISANFFGYSSIYCTRFIGYRYLTFFLRSVSDTRKIGYLHITSFFYQ